jgi:hypothetical protein
VSTYDLLGLGVWVLGCCCFMAGLAVFGLTLVFVILSGLITIFGGFCCSYVFVCADSL